MKILFVTDGRYPEYVNGVSIYIRYLAEELVKNGHDVHIFHHIKSGLLKSPKVISFTENSIAYYGLFNSPISFSEALVHPLKSCHEKKTEKTFLDLLWRVNPEIVHFHEFERTSSFCIDIVKDQNIPTLVSLHDYWLICPRLQLFTLNERVCEGPDEGKNCVANCLADGYLTRQYRKMLMILPDGHVLNGIKKLRNMYKKAKGEHLGQTSFQKAIKKNLSVARNRKMMEAFKARVVGNKSSLSKADLILAVSNCVKEVFERHGIDHRKIIVNQLGVKSVDWIKKKVRRFEKYPIQFGFLGHLGPSKGAHHILEAAKRISPGKANFLFYGGADEETLYDFKNSIRDLTHCVYMGRYNYKELDDVFNSFNILIIPSLWQETLGMIGLEAQAAGIPVIASDIGGMKDYVRHGINGLLFPSRDVEALTDCLNSVLEQPCQIEKMSNQAMNPKTIKEDYKRLISFYENLLNEKKNEVLNEQMAK